MRQLFELCGADRDVRYSPYTWRIRLCLLHKGLDFEGVPLRFLEKEPLSPARSKTVPVLRDGDTWVKESFDIALYLEHTYPEKPLFGGAIAEGQARLVNQYMDRTVLNPIFPMIIADIEKLQDADNGAYFRESRESRMRATLEELQARREEALPAFQKQLTPVRRTLEAQPFLSGDAPAWADYALMGKFMWARVVSSFELLQEGDAIHAWRERMLDLYDGHCRAARLGHDAHA